MRDRLKVSRTDRGTSVSIEIEAYGGRKLANEILSELTADLVGGPVSVDPPEAAPMEFSDEFVDRLHRELFSWPRRETCPSDCPACRLDLGESLKRAAVPDLARQGE